MNFICVVGSLVLGIFVGMVALMEVGRWLGRRRLERDPEGARTGVAAAEGAVFALLGLLIAFSFSGAALRFHERRRLISEECNAMGTAWLRLDLLPAAEQPAARESFRRYVDARLDVYRAIPDYAAVRGAVQIVSERQAELWGVVLAARGGVDREWEKILLPALNAMFDIGSTRTHAMSWHQPTIVIVLLCVLSLACAWLAGFAMAGAMRRPLAHILVFAAVVPVTVYVILDLEYPRQGLLRVDESDQILIELRAGMN